jgi:hypothetical protein
MNQAPVRENDVQDAGIPYLEPESDEPKTEPRIRVQLLLEPEPSGVLRFRAGVKHVRRLQSRLKLAPAIVLGALLGSAPYLVEQHVRARAADEPRITAPSPEHRLSRLQAAREAAPQSAPTEEAQAPAPLPPLSTAIDEDWGDLGPRPQRSALERRLLVRARKQLKSGDGVGAQLVLARLSQRIPHGKLMQQRKLLEIEVLQALGAKVQARRAAGEFAKSYPRSHQLTKLSALLLGS